MIATLQRPAPLGSLAAASYPAVRVIGSWMRRCACADGLKTPTIYASPPPLPRLPPPPPLAASGTRHRMGRKTGTAERLADCLAVQPERAPIPAV